MRPLIKIVEWTRGGRPPTRRMLEACAAFGLGVRAAPPRATPPRHIARAARIVACRLRAGRIVLIAGPSGCGKSTLLREIARALARRGERLVRVEPGAPRVDRLAGSIVDALPGPRALHALARAGLGDALLLVRRPRELSEGERWRFAIARAMASCERARGAGARTLLIDEFLTPLDRATARAVACTLARWVRASRAVRVVCATAHADVERWLNPDCTLRPCSEGVEIEQPGGAGGERSHSVPATRRAGAPRRAREPRSARGSRRGRREDPR